MDTEHERNPMSEQQSTDKRRKVLQMIAADMKKDARELDGKPFTGPTVGEHLGNQGAAIAVLAEIVESLVPDGDPRFTEAPDVLDPQPTNNPMPSDFEPTPPASGITYLLYSLRHNAYWMPASAGYTDDVDLAGRYSEAEAVQKVVASAHCGIRTQVTCMVAAPDNWAVKA